MLGSPRGVQEYSLLQRSRCRKRQWLFRASPVFQEVYGGKDDGKIVWTGFEFNVFKLYREMSVYGESITSYCTHCTPTPAITFRGNYRGHMVTLTVLLEPVPGSLPVEIVDTIRAEIRAK
jgi:hypothetical protein